MYLTAHQIMTTNSPFQPASAEANMAFTAPEPTPGGTTKASPLTTRP